MNCIIVRLYHWPDCYVTNTYVVAHSNATTSTHSNATTSAAETMAERKRKDVHIVFSTEIEVCHAVSRSSGSPIRPTRIQLERRKGTAES